jgi:hypothetical protein
MIKLCKWTVLVAVCAATTWCCFGEITAASLPPAVATSNGDLVWSATMLLVAFAFSWIATKSRKGGAGSSCGAG